MGDHEDKIRAAIAAGYNLPALSPVAMEAVDLASQEGVAAPRLAKVIERDPSLATDVLQAVVHEIRNPLMVVGGFVKKLAQTLSPDSEGSRYVGVILKEASRLEKIMEEMNRKLEKEREIPG